MLASLKIFHNVFDCFVCAPIFSFCLALLRQTNSIEFCSFTFPFAGKISERVDKQTVRFLHYATKAEHGRNEFFKV